jgi:hypothetical protein
MVKQHTIILIISAEFVTEGLSSVPSAEQNLGGHMFKDDREPGNCSDKVADDKRRGPDVNRE